MRKKRSEKMKGGRIEMEVRRGTGGGNGAKGGIERENEGAMKGRKRRAESVDGGVKEGNEGLKGGRRTWTLITHVIVVPGAREYFAGHVRTCCLPVT